MTIEPVIIWIISITMIIAILLWTLKRRTFARTRYHRKLFIAPFLPGTNSGKYFTIVKSFTRTVFLNQKHRNVVTKQFSNLVSRLIED